MLAVRKPALIVDNGCWTEDGGDSVSFKRELTMQLLHIML